MAKNKQAWFQGSTESVDKVVTNDPNKLGKDEKYPRQNPPVGDVRNYEQSAFEGAANATKKNFGPSGAEFKLKQDWQRIPSDEKVANASLSVGLTKNANAAKSVITVYAKNSKGEKTPVVKASLGQIWGKELNEKNVAKSYTEQYAKAIIAKIRKHGFSKIAFLLTGENEFAKRAGLSTSFVKKAQMAADGIEEEVSMDAPEGDVAVLEGDAPMGDDAAALDAEVAQTGAESEVTVDLLAGKISEVEAKESELVNNTSPESTAEVFTQLQDAEKMLEESKEEMASVAAKLKVKGLKASQKIALIKIAAEATNDAVSILEGSDDVLAKAQQALEAADAAMEAVEGLTGGEEVAEVEVSEDGAEGEIAMDSEDLEGMDESSEAPEMEATEEIVEAGLAKNYVKSFLKSRNLERKKAIAMGETEGYEKGKYNVVPEGAPKDGKGEIDSAHPQGGAEVTNLTAGGKPEGKGDLFETVTEAQDADLKATNKMPTGNLASRAAGKGTVKTAADSSAKSYWTELFGQGDGTSKSYGKDISKGDTVAGDAGKMADAVAAETQAKVIRAYELAEVASEKGFCDRTASAKSGLVKEILAFDDNSFVAFKKMLDKAPARAAASEEFVKSASLKMPRVGQKEVSADTDSESGFISRLSGLDWSK